MNQDLLDVSIKDVLTSNIRQDDGMEIEVGLSDVPALHPVVPYIILFQSPSPKPAGSFMDPEDMRCYDYLVKSVGRNHQETTRVSSQAREVMVGRNEAGFVCTILISGYVILNRETVSAGQVIKSNGPNLFERNDIYRIHATASA